MEEGDKSCVKASMSDAFGQHFFTGRQYVFGVDFSSSAAAERMKSAKATESILHAQGINSDNLMNACYQCC